MAYGLRTRAPIEHRPAAQAEKADAGALSERPWLNLSEACRFEVIEQALRAANDRIDGYPIAL
jgi:hypothetical protein